MLPILHITDSLLLVVGRVLRFLVHSHLNCCQMSDILVDLLVVDLSKCRGPVLTVIFPSLVHEVSLEDSFVVHQLTNFSREVQSLTSFQAHDVTLACVRLDLEGTERLGQIIVTLWQIATIENSNDQTRLTLEVGGPTSTRRLLIVEVRTRCIPIELSHDFSLYALFGLILHHKTWPKYTHQMIANAIKSMGGPIIS